MGTISTVILEHIILWVPFWVPVLAILLAVWKVSIGGRSLHFRERLWLFFLLLPVGVQGIWVFVFHVFLPHLISSYTAWSPYEYEVGMANLSLGLLGMVSFWLTDFGFRAAVTLMAVVFLLGSGIGHLIFMGMAGQFPLAITAVIVCSDILVPIILLVLLVMEHIDRRPLNVAE